MVTPGSTDDLQAMEDAGIAYQQNDSNLVCTDQQRIRPTASTTAWRPGSTGRFFYWSYWQGDPTTNTWTYGRCRASLP